MSRAREFADLASSADAGGLTGRNILQNGAMNVAQRGTSDSSAAAYLIDRFRVVSQGSFGELAFTQSQSSTVPSGQGFKNSLKIEVTTAETALSASDLFYVRQVIEAQNLQSIKYGTSSAEKLTLSFWVRSSLTGKYSVLFFNSDSTRSNTQSFNIDTADTWEYKTITIDGDTTGTFDNNEGYGMGVHITLASGSNFAGTPHTGWGAYSGTDDFSFSDNVDFSAQTGTFFLTGMQLEVGDKATSFEHRSFGEDLHDCQRYYYKLVDGNSQLVMLGSAYSTTDFRGEIRHPVEMRAAPTFIDSTGTNYYLAEGTGGDYMNSFNTAYFTTKAGLIYNNSDVSLTTGRCHQCLTSNASAKIECTAEF